MASSPEELGERPLGRFLRAISARRLGIAAVAGLGGAGLAYGLSWALAVGTCENGCPTASAPLPFVLLVGVTAAWAAASGARQTR